MTQKQSTTLWESVMGYQINFKKKTYWHFLKELEEEMTSMISRSQKMFSTKVYTCKTIQTTTNYKKSEEYEQITER